MLVIKFWYHLSKGIQNSVSSVHFSHSVMSDTLGPHGLHHSRPPRPSPTPGVYPNSSPLSWWCHPTISSSVIPFSSGLQSFPASGSFPISQFFTSNGQSSGASASNQHQSFQWIFRTDFLHPSQDSLIWKANIGRSEGSDIKVYSPSRRFQYPTLNSR